MKLDGGVPSYISRLHGEGRYKDAEPPAGRKVVFLNDNGYIQELEFARKIFAPYQVLTVKEIFVGTSSSTVSFEEVEGEFNTVMFGDIEDMSVVLQAGAAILKAYEEGYIVVDSRSRHGEIGDINTVFELIQKMEEED